MGILLLLIMYVLGSMHEAVCSMYGVPYGNCFGALTICSTRLYKRTKVQSDGRLHTTGYYVRSM
jgi:hypothetical protein